MADHIFLHLDEQTALAFDPLQWIIQKRGKKKGKLGPWKPRSFSQSKKAVLRERLEEGGCDIADLPEGPRSAFEALPDRFQDWYEQTGSILTKERNEK